MIEKTFDSATQTAQFILRPNSSMSWRACLVVMSVISVCLLSVTAVCIYWGLWLVLPFSGLELLALISAFYYVSWRNTHIEVLTLSADKFRVEKGRLKPEKAWCYYNLWAKIFVKQPSHLWYPAKIYVRSKGHNLEIGSFLRQKEKEILVKELKRVIYEREHSG